jgi:hypothetical protein
MSLEAEPPVELLAHVAQQIQVDPDAWSGVGILSGVVMTRPVPA